MNQIYVFNLAETLVTVIDALDELCPFQDAFHLEQINRQNTFHFLIPANNEKANFIIEGNLIAFKDLDGDFQLFEIKIINEIHEDMILKDVYCEHAVFELLDELIPFNWQRNQYASTILTQALLGTRWSPGTVTAFPLVKATVRMELDNPLSALKKMVTAFGGGEFKYRVTISGSSISGRFIDYLPKRGADTGKRFEYEKDINSVRREIDFTNVKTRLYGYGKAQEVPGGTRRVRFSDISQIIPRIKPLGDEFVDDPDALTKWGRAGGTRHRVGFYENPDIIDPVELLQRTNETLDQLKNPHFSYEMKVTDLERFSGLSHEKVRLGDKVKVIDRTFNPKLIVEARVIEIKRYLTEPEKDELILDNFKPLSVEDGEILREVQERVNSNQGVWQDEAYNMNMVNDSGFGNIPITGSVDGNQTFAVDLLQPDIGNFFWWQWRGSDPRILSTIGTGLPRLALFNFQAAVVKTQSNPYQFIMLSSNIGLDGPYTVSFYAAAYGPTTINGDVLAEVWPVNGVGTRIGIFPLGTSKVKIISSDKFIWRRGQVTVFNLPIGTEYLEINIKRDDANPTLNCLVDGIQCIPKDSPGSYITETELYRAYDGLAGALPRRMEIREDLQVGWDTVNSLYGFTLQQDGLFITRNNSQLSTAHSPAQLLPTNAFTKLNFTGPGFVDWHNEFDRPNSRFIIKQAGIYIMQVGIRILNIPNGATIALDLFRNGSMDTRLYQDVQATGGGIKVIQTMTLVFGAANDIFHIEIYCSAAGATTVQDGTQSTWKIFRVGGRR